MNDRLAGVLQIVFVVLLVGLSAPIVLSAGQDNGEDDGRILFREKCGNCHGQKGEGFRRVYPPIRNSRYLGEQLPQLPCIIRNGLQGEITVANRVFNQAMPGDPRMTEEEMALIISFMLNEWGHKMPVLEVDTWLGRCSGQEERENRQ